MYYSLAETKREAFLPAVPAARTKTGRPPDGRTPGFGLLLVIRQAIGAIGNESSVTQQGCQKSLYFYGDLAAEQLTGL